MTAPFPIDTDAPIMRPAGRDGLNIAAIFRARAIGARGEFAENSEFFSLWADRAATK
jgi:hypothetical protein